MIRTEIRSVSIERLQDFLRAQPEVREEDPCRFAAEGCIITLEELPPGGEGFWSTCRTKIRFEGDAHRIDPIYRRFFLNFLSIGG